MALTPKHMRQKFGASPKLIDLQGFTLKHTAGGPPYGFMVYGFHGLGWRTMEWIVRNGLLMCFPIKLRESHVLNRKALALG